MAFPNRLIAIALGYPSQSQSDKGEVRPFSYACLAEFEPNFAVLIKLRDSQDKAERMAYTKDE